MVEQLINTLDGGCNMDVGPEDQPTNTYRWPRNVQRSTLKRRVRGITNENSTKFRADIPGNTAIGYMRVEERNATLMFHIDGGSCISIFYHDTNEIKLIVRDKAFGCDWKFKKCMWTGYGHNGSKTIAPCNDLLVYFCSDDFTHVVNIDELMDEKRAAAIMELEEPCQHFRLIKTISGPRVVGKPMRGGGKDLPPGQYFYAARFKDESGNVSNFTPIQGPTYIGTKHNRFEEKSHQAIRVEVRNMSKHYSRVEIVVIPPIGSQEQDVAYTIYDGVYSTNGVSTVYYSSSQHIKTYSLGEILTKDIKWIRNSNMFIDQARINLYKLRHEFNFNGQKYANKIKVTILAYAVPADQAHFYTSMPPDEVVALGIAYKYLDQLTTPFFHIRGREGGTNELDCGCTLPNGHTGNNARLIKKYVNFTGKGNDWCFTSAQTTTINEGYNPASMCAVVSEEQPIVPRSSESADCNSDGKYRDEMDKEVSMFKTTNDSMDPCLDCAPEDTRTDLDHIENTGVRTFEKITDLFRTDKEVMDDCSIGKHKTIPQSVSDGYVKAIKNAEKDEEVQYRTVIEKKDGTDLVLTPVSGGSSAGASGGGGGAAGVMVRETVKGTDCSTELVKPILIAEYEPASWESAIPYPKTKDCDDEYFHEERAGKPTLHVKMPSADICPLFITAQSGVESRFDPSNIPGKRDTYAILLGIRLTGIYIPTDDELPKPLDKNEPYIVGIVPPQDHNKSVLYSGYFTHTFEGKVGGKTFAFPRHAANAFPAVDRNIDDNGSRLGKDWDLPLYNFHSPDIIGGGSFVYGDYIKIDGFLSGIGQVYDVKAKGKRVKENENREDRLGSRGALNLTTFTPNNFYTCLKGAEVAEHNSMLQNPAGVSKPLMNKNRESSIFLETAEALPTLPGGNKDRSFTGGGLDHEYMTTGQVWYGSIKRFNAEQYGNVESLQYANLGLIGRPGQTSVEGLVGTCFIQKWSDKRTSYISDKSGNYLNQDLEGQFPRISQEDYLGPWQARKRGVPDPPNRRGYRMEEFLGFWNSQKLPENGDKRDPKNMANLHPTFSAQEIAAFDKAQTDLYYWRTHTHLNHLWVSTNVNLYYRTTNEPETREVFAERLHGLELDSSITGVDPGDAWLNDYHCQHLQPSDKQQGLKIQIRTFLGIIMPFLLLGGFAGIEAPLEATATTVAAPGLLFLWMLATFNIFTPKKIDKFKGIPRAKMDSEGGQESGVTRGLKDNWGAYNWGFSALNDLNVFLGQPHPYNTCKCVGYSNDIRSSSKQLHSSPHDAWSNFQALSLMSLDGSSGALQLVVPWDNRVIAHTTDGVFPLQQKNLSIPTSAGAQLLGSSKYMENPPKMREGAFEGYAGTEDPHAGILCELGYFSIDYEGRDINHMSGDGFKPVNDEKCGIYHHIRNNFTFCSEGSCRDQMTVDGVHYALGYDPQRKLLLVTKHDAQPWTWSFDLRDGKAVSQHDYIPEFYFWDRNTLFAVVGGKIYSFNEPGSYGNFFGKDYPVSVEVVARTADSVPFTYQDSIMDTEVSVGDLLNREATFTEVTVYNDRQINGKLQFEHKNKNDKKAAIQRKITIPIDRDVLSLWSFNKIKANEASYEMSVMDSKPCGQPPEVNESNVTFAKNHTKTVTVLSKYLIFKFDFFGQSNKIKASESELIFNKLYTSVDVNERFRKGS